MRVDESFISEKGIEVSALWYRSCWTGHKSQIFKRIYIKFVTVWKVLTRSLKWDQLVISSFIILTFTSKTWLIVKRMDLKKKSLERLEEQSHQKTCSSYTNPCNGECKPSFFTGLAHTRYQNTVLSFVYSIWASYKTYSLTAAFLSAKIVVNIIHIHWSSHADDFETAIACEGRWWKWKTHRQKKICQRPFQNKRHVSGTARLVF